MALTLITQVGGLVYLLYYPIGRQIKKRISNQWAKIGLRIGTFSLLMLVSSLILIPKIAPFFGRVPLPTSNDPEQALQAGNYFFVLTNRHYVKPQLKSILIDAAQQLKRDYPDATLLYLDAGFPFWTGFPLLPHLSHDDGEKADLAFIYQKTGTKKIHNQLPTLLGYGFYASPKGKEKDTPADCAKKGYWQYDLLGKFAGRHPDFTLYNSANTCLLKALARDKRVGKIFIEPHLKSRLEVNQFDNIRFHGCRAVRHDDHIHIQL